MNPRKKKNRMKYMNRELLLSGEQNTFGHTVGKELRTKL